MAGPTEKSVGSRSRRYLKQGKRELTFELTPLVPIDQRKSGDGLSPSHGRRCAARWRKSTGSSRGTTASFSRRAQCRWTRRAAMRTREVIEQFARRAYRRPAETAHVDKLVELAKANIYAARRDV